jgi:hypothetical protein
VTATCPVCNCEQPDGLLCHNDTTKLERALGDVRWIVTELDTAASKQARIGNPSGGGGLARERNPISWGAVEAADTLGNVLTTWARDIGQRDDIWRINAAAVSASYVLLGNIDAIRRHPAVAELVDEVVDAVEQARRAIDRPADRVYLGQCLSVIPGAPDGDGIECYEEIWGKVDAHEVTCRVCGVTHEVAERRAGLLDRARPLIVTVKQAAEYMGEVGGITVNQKTIRSWIERDKLADHSGGVGERTIRLGDLLELVLDKSEVKARAA